MRTFRRVIALALMGLMIGGVMSMLSASPATARIYRNCDKKVEQMEVQAAKQYEQAQKQYDRAASQAESAKNPKQAARNDAKLAAAQAELDAAAIIYERVMAEAAYHRELWGC